MLWNDVQFEERALIWCHEDSKVPDPPPLPSSTYAQSDQDLLHFVRPWQNASLGIFLFLFRFYGSVNPVVSCRARSIYLTKCLLGRLSPLSSYPVLCTFFHQKQKTALLESAGEREWPHKIKIYFMISLQERMLAARRGSNMQPPDHQSDGYPTEPPRPPLGHNYA